MTSKLNILCLPDAHASPQSSNRRFEWLGNLIVERQPDVIYCAGDLADMSTLSSYDKGMKQSWGKTYKEDVKSVKNAQALMFAPIEKYNNTQAKKKKPQYNPKTIQTLGNHCQGRYDTFLNKNGEFTDHISVKDLEYDKYWDVVVPYLDVCTFSGIAMSHFFYNKSQRYPIPSAKAVLTFNAMPSLWGHSHSFDYYLTYNVAGRRLAACNLGAYLDPFERGDTYNYTGGQGSGKWWNGITMLNGVNEFGEFDIEQISMETIQAKFS